MKHIKKFESFRPINEEAPIDMEYSKQYSPNCNWNPEERSELEKLGADSIGDSDATFIEDDETYKIEKYAADRQSQTSKCVYSVKNINNSVGYSSTSRGGFLKISTSNITSFQNAVNILRDAIVEEKSPRFKERLKKRMDQDQRSRDHSDEKDKRDDPWYKNMFGKSMISKNPVKF